MTSRLLILAVLASACAGGSEGNIGRVQAALIGSSSVPGGGGGVMNAPNLGVKEIIVTIDKVTAHSSEAGWVQLSGKEVTIDVLQLAKFGTDLGFANIPAGKVTQLRLYVKEGGTQYVTTDADQRIDLKVPSGIQSGIKLHGMFDVDACTTNTVPLQFDGKKSIWVHDTGQETLWILRPVIRTGHVDVSDMCPGGNPGGNPGGSPGDPMDPTDPGEGGGGGLPPPPGGLPGGGSGGGGIGENPGGGMGGTGSACSSNTGCLSGSCVNGACSPGGADAPCMAAGDCVSGSCTAGVCAPGAATGSGTACTFNAQCLSNACVNGSCEAGGQGQPCGSASDCLSGYTCTAGSCAPPPIN